LERALDRVIVTVRGRYPESMQLDPRQVRTRQALAAALARLLEAKPLDEISVAELCREAGVHRTTFYGHFDGVAEFALAEFSRGIDEIAEVEVEAGAETSVAVADRYLASMRAILDLVAAERAGYRTLFGPGTAGVFRGVLDARLRHRARLALEVWRAQAVPGAPRTDAAVEQAAAYIAGGLVGAIETWARSDETDASAEAARISTLMPSWWPRG
jgi:AcrR family transcriptional regulator